MTDSAASATRLPRPSGHLSRAVSAHPRAVDALLASVLCAAWLASMAQEEAVRADMPFANPDGSFPLAVMVVRYLTAAAACASLLLRRRHPVPVFAIAAGVGILNLQYDAWGAAVGAIALYSVAVYASARTARLSFIAAAAAILVFGAFVPAYGIGNALFTATALLAVLYFGISIGERRRYLAALITHAESLEREQEQRARLAVAEERERIAREMHDIVAHGLTVMVRLADGAAAGLAAGGEQESPRRAVVHIAETGRRVLGETRRMLGALGAEEHAERHPQPTLADLPVLSDEFRELGLRVTLDSHGEPPRSPVLQLTIYRAVQEALTNVVKHAASPTSTHVLLDYQDGITVTVADDGQHRPDRAPGRGRGLIGMEQRAAMFGGTVEAEATPRGWRTTMTLPDAMGDDA